jgi:two-component system, NtrC family, sensor kinase
MIFDSGQPNRSYVFGLEHVPLPAIVCDRDGRIFWSNDHFSAIAEGKVFQTGVLLSGALELVDDSMTLPGLDELATKNTPFDVTTTQGHIYAMHVGTIGELFGIVFAPRQKDKSFSLSPIPTEFARSSQAPPTGTKLLEAFIFLSKQLNLTMREEELIQLFVRTFEDLFPTRLFCIRLFDQDSLAMTQVYANGRLLSKTRDHVSITNEACISNELLNTKASKFLQERGILRVEEYQQIFADSVGGFDVPLYDGNGFYGVLNFEYLESTDAAAMDRVSVTPLTHQMCAALRNARLLAETTLLKEYLEKLLDSANAPVIVLDRSRRVTVVNQAFEKLTGYERDDILDMDFMSFLPESEQSKLLPAVLATLRGESQLNIEMRIPHASGRTVAHIAFNTAPVMSRYAELESVILVGQDLTEVRALQNQVIHSEKLATLGQVAAGVAHELNNPLTSITVYAGYLTKKLAGEIDDGDYDKLTRIVESAERIQSFSRELVTYARPLEEEPKLINVLDLVERSVSFCEHLISRTNATVTADIQKELDPVYGIPGQLEQVFVNLITNACHALPESNGTVQIRASKLDEERIIFHIEDNGHGIMEEDIESVFEPFYTTKAVGEGTGLGLPIVRNVLVNHNAEIQVKSKIGHGTTFTITIFSG